MKHACMLFAALLALAMHAAFAADPITGCKAVGKLVPICGLPGSEDLEVLPTGKRMFVSLSRIDSGQLPKMVFLPGGIALLDLTTRKSHVVYPAKAARAGSNDWGDSSCPGEIGTALAPHGIHLSKRSDGKWQLLVVNHSDRESVEMFEVTGTGGKLGLSWRGCAVAPEHSMLNDVAALPQGGFLVTNMMFNTGPDSFAKARVRSENGENTGNVLHWRRDTGYAILPGSESPFPNGIQVDKTGTYAYLDVCCSSGAVRKLDIKSGKTVGAAAVTSPDNISWAEDGRLLVAGVIKRKDIATCVQAGFSHPCGAQFHVTAINPETMATETLFVHEGSPMGAATVAVSAGKYLYVGTIAGDRILRAPLMATKKSLKDE